jgi:hypothetical protein
MMVTFPISCPAAAIRHAHVVLKTGNREISCELSIINTVSEVENRHVVSALLPPAKDASILIR